MNEQDKLHPMSPVREVPGSDGVLVRVIPFDQAAVRHKKMLCGILAIMLGFLGVHKFILGYVGIGMVMLLVSVVSFGWCTPLMLIVGLIEGIVYLTRTDYEFYERYLVGRREWF